jgi:hypothetical protein
MLKIHTSVGWNYKSKITRGWSIFNVLMEFTGDIVSVSEIRLSTVFVGINIFSSYHKAAAGR